jgi:hypothetical protein
VTGGGAFVYGRGGKSAAFATPLIADAANANDVAVAITNVFMAGPLVATTTLLKQRGVNLVA